ncbi:MAG TPA: putative Ig domain-containing protein [Pseudonocardiaceae bacterium]|nr:putative Ig domain-containing protein [Pseudonocardiaceae bacterium]
MTVLGTTPAASAATTPTIAGPSVVHSCPTTVTPGKFACQVLKRTDVHTVTAQATPNAIPAGVGYGPSQLQAAYNLVSAAASNGGGRTIALVDAFDYGNAASDLANYRSSAGLPAATFTKVNQNGQTSPLPPAAPANDDWTLEEALDLDMASAICPKCSLVLVEAQSDSGTGLFTAENTAANLAGYISNSWGGSESASDTGLDNTNFNHPGSVITASAGDSGFGTIYPSTSPNVVAVGGTRLVTASNTRGWSETVWGSSGGGEGTGSGCSSVEPKPAWQTDTGCARRTATDVAADADPTTGVAVFDTSNGNSGWTEVGGTSASSPMVAAMYALAGANGTTPAKNIYQHAGTSALNDVTSGADGSCSPAYLCTAEVGYDGPTGEGTPNGLTALTPGTGGTALSANNPGNQTGTVGTAVSLTLSASGGTAPYTWTATGLPTGLSISSAGVISGTPSAAGTFSVTATVHDSASATASTSFSWTINPTGGGGCTAPGQKLGNPGFESGNTVWTSTPAVIGQNGPSEPAHAGTWDAWMDGYGTTHTDRISQSVTIPSGCSATLSFFLHIDTAETTTTTQFDKLTVTLGTTTLGTFSNLNHATGYTSHSFNVSSFAGQTVTLTITGTEDSSLQTSFVVDDTALTTS